MVHWWGGEIIWAPLWWDPVQWEHTSLLLDGNSGRLEVPKGLAGCGLVLGLKKNIRLLLKLCWTWDLLPTLQEWLNLKKFFQCKLICHECKADKETYMRRTLQAERYSIDEFWGHCIKPGNICFLAWTLFCFHQGQWSLYLFISPLQKLYVLIRDMFPSGQIAH